MLLFHRRMYILCRSVYKRWTSNFECDVFVCRRCFGIARLASCPLNLTPSTTKWNETNETVCHSDFSSCWKYILYYIMIYMYELYIFLSISRAWNQKLCRPQHSMCRRCEILTSRSAFWSMSLGISHIYIYIYIRAKLHTISASILNVEIQWASPECYILRCNNLYDFVNIEIGSGIWKKDLILKL